MMSLFLSHQPLRKMFHMACALCFRIRTLMRWACKDTRPCWHLLGLPFYCAHSLSCTRGKISNFFEKFRMTKSDFASFQKLYNLIRFDVMTKGCEDGDSRRSEKIF